MTSEHGTSDFGFTLTCTVVDLNFFIVHDVPGGGLQIMKINCRVLLGLVLGGAALALGPIAEAGAGGGQLRAAFLAPVYQQAMSPSDWLSRKDSYDFSALNSIMCNRHRKFPCSSVGFRYRAIAHGLQCLSPPPA